MSIVAFACHWTRGTPVQVQIASVTGMCLLPGRTDNTPVSVSEGLTSSDFQKLYRAGGIFDGISSVFQHAVKTTTAALATHPQSFRQAEPQISLCCLRSTFGNLFQVIFRGR
ncbi:unnamed protein product [Polarella glacialis]|uniref:Uncharacterized protein n=1 Tax=Polarella glacialis TaxID=89957 RepID=A0A813DE05_POLGL|nr:unnamed protein product [Polarella glacialis]